MIVVEVLNRMGRVRERSQHTSFPVRIGRSYHDNDIVLDDDYVSPEHLVLEQAQDGHVVARDLHSENGLIVLPGRKRVPETVVQGESLLRIGHTILRLRTSAFALPPTRREGRYFDSVSDYLNRGGVFLVVVIATVSWLYFDTYWNHFSEPEWGRLVVTPIWVLVGLSAWAGAWSMASKISQQTFSFKIHASIACLALLVASGFAIVREYYVFAFAAELSGDIVLWAMAVVWISALLWAHLRLCTLMGSRRLALNAVALAVCLVALFGVSRYSSTTEFESLASFRTVLKPPAFQIIGATSPETFFARFATLQEEVDASLQQD